MPDGYEIHRGKIRVYFNYKNELCREPLHLDDKPENITYAKGLAATINHEIKTGTFEYSRHFPNSKKLDTNRLNTWVDIWLEIKSSKVAPSTFDSYDRWCRNYILPKWGKHQAEHIDAIDIERWIADELTSLSSKSIKEIVSVIRQIYVLYRNRNRSIANPTDGILVRLPDDEEPDAFDMDEIKKIICTPSEFASEKNAVEFAIWTGPRPSEWLSLGWDDVSLKTGECNFSRGIVRGIYKATKTKRSKRSVDLLPPAAEALERQRSISEKLPPVKINVLQRDNRTWREESFRPVFVETKNLKPFDDVKSFNRKFFNDHLENAEVRHRGVSMCRHTFASHMLSRSMPVDWICDQMGHTTDAMLRKKYAKYFKKDRRVNPIALASKAFDF